jgi:hypothetical protein
MILGRCEDETVPHARHAQTDREAGCEIHKDGYTRQLTLNMYTNIGLCSILEYIWNSDILEFCFPGFEEVEFEEDTC